MLNRCLGVAAAVIAFSAGLAAEQTYGSGVSLKEATPLTRVLEQPTALAGKTVRVEGVVTAVCSEMGCWMALAAKDAPSQKTLLIKVEEGVIVFPVSAKGHRATAEGVLERVGTHDKDGQAAAHEHAAAEHREEHSAGGSWQLKATGAVVY